MPQTDTQENVLELPQRYGRPGQNVLELPQQPQLPQMFSGYDPAQERAVEGPYQGGWVPFSQDPISQALLATGTAGGSLPRLFHNLAWQTLPQMIPDKRGRYLAAVNAPSIMRDYEANIKSKKAPPPKEEDLDDILAGLGKGKKPKKIPITKDPFGTEVSGEPGYEKPPWMREAIKQPNVYTPAVRAQAESTDRPFSLGKTQPLRQGYPYDTVQEVFPEDITDPSPPIWPMARSSQGIPSKFGAPDEPFMPLGKIWSGQSLGGTPLTSMDRLQQMQKTGGMNKGWFSNTPPGNFGPMFVGADPKDLPPVDVMHRDLRVDPTIEIRPRWIPGEPPYVRGQFGVNKNPRGFSEYGQSTASGQQMPRISVHPSKLHVLDDEGNYYGTVAQNRPGLTPGTEREMGVKQMKRQPLYEESEFGVGPNMLTNPQEVANQNLQAREFLKNNPNLDAPTRDFYTKLINSNVEYLGRVRGQPPVPLKNWYTTKLPDIRSLFEEAE